MSDIEAGIRRRRRRIAYGTGAGALLITGGAVALAVALGTSGNGQAASVTEAPGQPTVTTTAAAPRVSPSVAPWTQPTASAVAVALPSATPAAVTTSPAMPTLSTPAALMPALAGRKDFGQHASVVNTTGGPCLSVDRLVELSGAPASAWVAKHPYDAAVNDLGVIADEDGPVPVCLPLTSKPQLRLSVLAGEGMRAVTLAKLRQVLDASVKGDAEHLGFDTVGFIRWHYDAKGAVDQVTGWWTP